MESATVQHRLFWGKLIPLKDIQLHRLMLSSSAENNIICITDDT